MRFKTKDIDESGVEIDLPVTEAWIAKTMPELDAHLPPEGLRFKGNLAPSGSDFLLRGHLRGALLMSCGRCLEPAKVVIDTPVTVSFVEREPSDDDGEREVALEDDADFVVFEGGEIDVGEELREEILLAVPMSPRHEPECAGICSICGGNRDQTPCDCLERAQRAASPFAGLAKLKS